ncbi:MAG: phage portal protein, partial [Clostridia bacterium]|nr:phage portal protein [Clostridia bacterium]
MSKAFSDGDALIVKEPYGDGLVVADSFEIDDDRPVYVYRDIMIGKRKIERLNESEILYIRPNWKNVEPLIRKMSDSFLRMMASAMNQYLFNNGQHWKVHVDQISEGEDDWRQKFTEILNTQIKPFFDSVCGVLPEMEGYSYTQIGGGSGGTKGDEVRALEKSIWTETGRAFLIPTALTGGDQQDTTVAKKQFLEDVIDPFAGILEQEINRKRFTVREYLRGSYLK